MFSARCRSRRWRTWVSKPVWFIPGSRNEFGFFALAGPTFALGLSATNKENGATLDLFEDYLKRFDIKLGIGAGVCYNDLIEFRVGYDWSLLNISQVSSTTGHLNYLHIGLAYKF